MNILRYYILLLLFCVGFPCAAQITFFADTLSGCESLEVTFEYRNNDLIDSVATVAWDFGNGQIGTGPESQTVIYDMAGVYSVSMLINNNTTITRNDYIKVHSSPIAQFFWSDSLELGSYTVVFVAAPQPVDTVTYTYEWLIDDGDNYNTRALIHRFPESGDYNAFLRITHPESCMAQWGDIVTVKDSLDCPNVFTPNEDGINDYFIVSSNGVTLYSLQVFSRSGILVYKAEAPLLIWDGRNLSGQELLPGTYYYIIRPLNGSGRFQKTGFVELYR